MIRAFHHLSNGLRRKLRIGSQGKDYDRQTDDFVPENPDRQAGDCLMAKYSRVQFVFICRTCGQRITLSIYFGESAIWNNKDAEKLAAWHDHEGHDTELTHEFFIGDKDLRSYRR
jgi:hypothetical protein